MERTTIKGVVQTLCDGIKDAEMQYNYAVEARDDGSEKIAMLHIDEAKKRLAGVREWYDNSKELMGRDESMIAKMLIDHHKTRYRELVEKVNSFSMSAK